MDAQIRRPAPEDPRSQIIDMAAGIAAEQGTRAVTLDAKAPRSPGVLAGDATPEGEA